MGFQFHRKLFHPYDGSIDAIIFVPCRTCCSPIPSPLHSPISEPNAANSLLSSFLDGNHMDSTYFLHVTMISIASTIGLLMILFTVSKIIRHFCSRRRYVSRRNPPILFDIRGDSRFSDDEGPAIGHNIWIIPTVGLRQSTIESITAFKYRRDEGPIEGTECLICLGEFQEGQSLRLLPKCTHSFHIPCIDTWLISHNSCPMCRAPIVHDTGNRSGGGVELVRTTERDSISSFSSENEETQMENLGGEAESHHLGESESSGVRVGDDDSCVFFCEDGEDSAIIPDKNLICSEKMNCHSSIPIGCVSSAREFQEEIIQPMRRLVSVDSSCDSMMFYDAVDSNSDVESTDTNFDENRVSSSKDFATAKQGSEGSTIHKVASIGHALQKRHFSLRRSSSHRIKFMFFRRCRSQSSTLTL